LETAYRGPGGSQSVHTQAPSLNHSAKALPYNALQLADAWHELVQAADELGQFDTFRFDLVNVGRQALVNQGAGFYGEVVVAWRGKNRERLRQASQRFLQWIADMDDLLTTRPEFLLGCWLEDAKRWGKTAPEKTNLEWNARNQITLWGNWDSSLRDYARKEWSGMLSGFYAPRWQMLFDRLDAALAKGQPFDAAQCDRDIRHWEEAWTRRTDAYPTTPRGDSLAVSRRLWAKYAESRR
jgi:alpha-N-acetylglucosaminidase